MCAILVDFPRKIGGCIGIKMGWIKKQSEMISFGVLNPDLILMKVSNACWIKGIDL